MLKHLTKNIHQSYFIVALALGIIVGTILALIFRINFFASPLWLVFASVLLLIAYFKPKLAFVIIAFIAGMIFIFFRSTTELAGEDYIRQFYDQIITVTGNSMEPTFSDGEIILVKSQSEVQNGELGIFIGDGEGYFKRFMGDCLRSLNPSYEDIPLSRFRTLSCCGKVIGQLPR